MSLIHRTSSTESFSRPGPRAEDENNSLVLPQSQGRKLSYNPVGPTRPTNQGIGAYEVSKTRRIGEHVFDILLCALV